MGLFGSPPPPPPPPPPPASLDTTTLALVATAIVLAVSLSQKIGGLSAALLGGTAALLILYSQSPEIFSVYVWPPSRSSAPVLLLISSAFAALTAYSFSAGKKSEDAQRFADQKRKLIAMQLTQAMRWDKDEEEGEEGAEKDKEGAEKKEEEGDEKEKEEKEKKRPPESAELLAMLFDDVEEVHVTNFGIAADDEAYAGVLALFKERVPIDLAEAERCTRLSRGADISAADVAFDDDIKRVALFNDGAKLKELVELYEKKIKKNFGSLVPADKLRAANATLTAIELSQRQGALAVLYKLVLPSLPLYFAALILMTFDSAVGATTYHSVALILDGLSDKSVSVETMYYEFFIAFVKIVLCIFSHLTAHAFTSKCAGRFANKVRIEVLRGVLRQDTVYFDIHPTGVIQERLNHDADELAGKIFHLPMELVHNTMVIISNSATVYAIKPELFWIIIAPLPIISLMQKAFIKKMEKMHERGRRVAEHVVANTNEMVRELRTVRSFAMEAEEADNYTVNSQYKTDIDEWASVVHLVFFISPLITMFIGMRFFALATAGSFVVSDGLTVGMAIQTGNCADHLQHCVRGMLDMIPNIVKVRGPVGRVCDALNAKPTIEPYPGMPPKLKVPIKGRIDFVDVNFTFPSEPAKQILHGLTFTAKPGEKVAFVGATGCGKSTAIQLVQRFYAASSGDVQLDLRPIADYDVHYLRRKISVVAQDNVLFSTTIRENITYGLPKERRDALTTEDVEDICRKANAWDFINGFPRKLETYCGERGVKLSGGQKQRLAIARAIIRDPQIVLLDEATSALDSKSEEVVQKALDKMIEQNASGCTLVIAHRLSTVKNCDQILCMQKGHVLERGTHEALLKIPIVKKDDGKEMVSGLYHELWQTQMGEDSEKKDEKKSVTVERLMKEVASLKKKLANAERALPPASPRSAMRKELKKFGSVRFTNLPKENIEDDDDDEPRTPRMLLARRSMTAPAKNLIAETEVP